METLLGNSFVTIGSAIAVTILAVYTFLSPKLKGRREDYDKVGNEFIELLKKAKEELLLENSKLRSEFDNLVARFELVNKDHQLLKEIFQGRDKDTVMFREKGLEAFEQAKHTNDFIVKTHAKILETNMLLNKLLKQNGQTVV